MLARDTYKNFIKQKPRELQQRSQVESYARELQQKEEEKSFKPFSITQFSLKASLKRRDTQANIQSCS